MKHCQCTLSDLDINKQEIYLSMGYMNTMPEIDILFMIDQIYAEIDKICKPQYIYNVYSGNTLDTVSITIDNIKFKTGKIITHYLEGMEKCCVFATTAGIEYDAYKKQLRKKGEILEEYIADAIGSVIAEACVNNIAGELAEKMDGSICTYPYSPGYCNWKLAEQQLLFSLLPDAPCGIRLTESCLMLPIKSTTGIIGIGKNIKRKAYACNICENKTCFKRREKESLRY